MMTENGRRCCAVRSMITGRIVVAVLVAWATIAGRVHGGDDLAAGDSMQTIIGITVPSERATLAGVRAARIAALHEEEGAPVTEDQIVVSLDAGVQVARTKIAHAEANSSIRVELARAEWRRAEREVERIMDLRGDRFAASKELDDAVTAAAIAKLEFRTQEFELNQARRTLAYEEELLEQYRLRAPFDGYVTEHHKHVGETVDQLEGIVTLMRIDPLEVLMDCPTELGPFVAAGDAYMVMPQEGSWAAREGTVTYVSRHIDGGSQTFLVKLVVDNPDEAWLSGMKVAVDFSAPIEHRQDRHTRAAPPGVVPASLEENAGP